MQYVDGMHGRWPLMPLVNKFSLSCQSPRLVLLFKTFGEKVVSKYEMRSKVS